jgi:uncharacterized membrane protein
MVHFPIAFLTGAALSYFLAWIFRSEKFAFTAFSSLVLGAVSAAVAAGTGLYAEGGVMVSLSVRERLLERHEQFMLAVTGVSLVLALWAGFGKLFPNKGRVFFVLLLLIQLGIMAVGADYGARMVYDYNAGGAACSQPIEFTK